MASIAVFTPDSDLLLRAHALAEQLHLPFTEDADYLLLFTPDYIGIKPRDKNGLPFYVDFVSGKLNYRRQHLSLRREALARALGLKNTDKQAIIVDATAGLARDSFIIAALGFKVKLIERSPIIHALVNDGIERALKHPDVAPIVKRMHLLQDNAISYFKHCEEKPDIIYLDPMFPERKKSALSKKEMRLFHEIVGDDTDSDQLLKTALACATKRVVVKRPRLADALAGIKPAFSMDGSSSRFDIYLSTP